MPLSRGLSLRSRGCRCDRPKDRHVWLVCAVVPSRCRSLVCVGWLVLSRVPRLSGLGILVVSGWLFLVGVVVAVVLVLGVGIPSICMGTPYESDGGGGFEGVLVEGQAESF